MVEIKVPTVGESISEVVIGDWLKPEGSAVLQDEIVVSLETDKVNVDVPAPAAGVLRNLLKKKGETARVGEVIGYVEEGAKAEAPGPTPVPAPATEQRIMPAAQRVIAQAGLDAGQVQGTGPGGRVLKEDAERAAQQPPASGPGGKSKLAQGQEIPLIYAERPPEPPPKVHGAQTPVPVPLPEAPKPPPAPRVEAPVVKAEMPAIARREEVVPMSPLRRRVAERLVQAQQTAAILTTFNEADMGAVMELRKKHQEAFTAKHGVKLGFMSFFVKAAVEALKAYPLVNAQIRGGDIVYQHFYDIGVAVGGGKGLVVPVLRDADKLSFAEIEKQLADLGTRAKAGTLRLEELQGGTFSISNGGVYGSMMSTPILNPPQSGILGMHAIQDRPVGVNGQIVLRPMMYLALSYDHRLVDGREAVGFLVRIKQCIEAPERMLLDA